VSSPVLLNVALHGLEEAAGVRHRAGGDAYARNDSPVLVRYADDFVVCCLTEQQAEGVRERLGKWLAGRGLSFNQDKTRIVPLTQGFGFLGWTFRRYPSGKLLITPSKAAIRTHREKLAAEMRRLRGSNATAVIATLTPLIRGWTAYHRGMASSEAFRSLTNYMWTLTWKWARHSHPNKSAGWVQARYFGTFNPSRKDKWVFGDRKTGRYLRKHSWTKIRRHPMVKGPASPDDPDLAGYWRYRRDKHRTPLDGSTAILLARQRNCCPLCGDRLIDPGHLPSSPEQWQDWWHGVTQRATGRAPSTPGQQPGTRENPTSLIHLSCRRALAARQRKSTAHQPAAPQGLA
jgi:RNA-directed DNA polymerase